MFNLVIEGNKKFLERIYCVIKQLNEHCITQVDNNGGSSGAGLGHDVHFVAGAVKIIKRRKAHTHVISNY